MELVREKQRFEMEKSDEFRKICNICIENESNAVVMECGHGGICYECSLGVWKATGVCHMCRLPISQVLQIRAGDKEGMVTVVSTTRAVYNGN